MPEPRAPRLQKTPFIAADCALIGIAAWLLLDHTGPIDPLMAAMVMLAGIVGALLLVAPFLADYAAELREDGVRMRRANEEAAQRLTSLAREIDLAGTALRHATGEAQAAARATEELPRRVREVSEELQTRLAQAEEEGGERFQSVSDLLTRAAARLGEIAQRQESTQASALATAAAMAKLQEDARTAVHPAPAPAAAPAWEQTLADWSADHTEQMRRLEVILERLEAVAARRPEPEPARASVPVMEAPAPAPAAEPEPPRSAPETVPTEVPPVAQEPARPRRRKAPPPPEEPATPPAEEVPAVPVAVAPVPVVTPERAQEADSAKAVVELLREEEEEGTSELGLELEPQPHKPAKFRPIKGAAAIVARAYIGIGNKLFVRGEGPGLSQERGVPMQFIEIGKWGWSCPEVGADVRLTILKNDEEVALDGELRLEAGQTLEVNPSFSR